MRLPFIFYLLTIPQTATTTMNSQSTMMIPSNISQVFWHTHDYHWIPLQVNICCCCCCRRCRCRHCCCYRFCCRFCHSCDCCLCCRCRHVNLVAIFAIVAVVVVGVSHDYLIAVAFLLLLLPPIVIDLFKHSIIVIDFSNLTTLCHLTIILHHPQFQKRYIPLDND